TCNPARGSVVEVHVSRPNPGRFEAALEQAAQVLSLVESRGATCARLFRLGYAGAGSGLFMLSWETANLRAQGRLGDMWSTDPEMVAIASAQFALDAAVTPVWDGLYQVVPI